MHQVSVDDDIRHAVIKTYENPQDIIETIENEFAKGKSPGFWPSKEFLSKQLPSGTRLTQLIDNIARNRKFRQKVYLYDIHEAIKDRLDDEFYRRAVNGCNIIGASWNTTLKNKDIKTLLEWMTSGDYGDCDEIATSLNELMNCSGVDRDRLFQTQAVFLDKVRSKKVILTQLEGERRKIRQYVMTGIIIILYLLFPSIILAFGLHNSIDALTGGGLGGLFAVGMAGGLRMYLALSKRYGREDMAKKTFGLAV